MKVNSKKFFEMIREGRNGRIKAASGRRPAEVLKKVENDFCREPAEPRSVRGVLEGAGESSGRKGKIIWSSEYRSMVDALEPEDEEGRGKLRKAGGRSKHPTIPGLPNGVTRMPLACTWTAE